MNFFCTEGPVQKQSDPVFLVNVICRVNARLFPQGTHQLWLNFQVNDINPLIPIDTYFFRQESSAQVPAAVEWFANLDNPRTRRAYQNDLEDFCGFVGLASADGGLREEGRD